MSLINKVVKGSVRKIMLLVCPRFYAYQLYLRAHVTHRSFYGGYDRKDMATLIDDSLRIFLTPQQIEDKRYVKDIIIDIVLSDLRYGTNPTEYFCYDFFSKKDFERERYLPRKQKDELLISQIGDGWKKSLDFIKDKNLFYQKMKQFFKRETCPIESVKDKDEFCRIFSKYGCLMVKPTRGGCGSGIEIISLSDYNGNAGAAFDKLLSLGSFIAEEIVEQDSRISRFNSSSLNTFRIPTFRTKDGIKIFYPSIRIGRAGSIVDNAGAGGTFAAIDAETGVIITDGFDKHGHHFKKHPDSNIEYKGVKIPEWDNLKKIVTEIHNAMPIEHKYVAYDMALSTRGWVVIEANWGEISMPQIEFNKGLKEDFVQLLKS